MNQLTRITFNPEVMGGKHCIRGLRVTVGTIVGLMASGRTPEEILKAYPYLELADIYKALAYAALRVEENENIKPTSYVRRPNHIVKCAIPSCNNLGFRQDGCFQCGEYKCSKHLSTPIQGKEFNTEAMAFISINDINERTCFPCDSQPKKVINVSFGSTEAKEIEKEIHEEFIKLQQELSKNKLRKKYSLLLFEIVRQNLAYIDSLESSPLEQKLWAEILARGLDDYIKPQIKLYDEEGIYIVRADFASTLLKIAIFTDGSKTYHSSPQAQARDAKHNQRIQEMGWVVKRYGTNDIESKIEEVIEEIYQLVCLKILQIS
jgi:uncharacterized protein (DUF433 family)/very-short-patch-repair endonuclease